MLSPFCHWEKGSESSSNLCTVTELVNRRVEILTQWYSPLYYILKKSVLRPRWEWEDGKWQMVLCHLHMRDISLFPWHQIGLIQRASSACLGWFGGKGNNEPCRLTWHRAPQKQGFTHLLELLLWEPLKWHVYKTNNYLIEKEDLFGHNMLFTWNTFVFANSRHFIGPRTWFI